MVSTAAVVVDTATKLGEHQQNDVVTGIVFAQIVEKATDRCGNIAPQTVVHPNLVGVTVEAAVVAVEYPRAEVSLVHLGNALELTGNRGIRILDGAVVSLGGGLEDIGGFEAVQTGLAQVIHYEAAADGGRVEAGEPG